MPLRPLLVALFLPLAGWTTFAPSVAAQAAPPARIAPPGFREVATESGVTLWRKNREYVQVVSPHRGAVLHLLHGPIIPSEGAGTNFARRDLREWWTEWQAQEPLAFTLTNGQFFNMNNASKSPLAFSTKINGVVYAGYGDGIEYAGCKMALRIGSRHATVDAYDDNAGSLYAFPEPNIIVGLRPDVSKAGNVRRGRTFVGTMPNGNLLLFTSPAATQRYAERILIAFGADRKKIMMLDGGGSSQMIHDGTLLLPAQRSSATPLRRVPLAIGVTRAR
jgi:hypothetical protein